MQPDAPVRPNRYARIRKQALHENERGLLADKSPGFVTLGNQTMNGVFDRQTRELHADDFGDDTLSGLSRAPDHLAELGGLDTRERNQLDRRGKFAKQIDGLPVCAQLDPAPSTAVTHELREQGAGDSDVGCLLEVEQPGRAGPARRNRDGRVRPCRQIRGNDFKWTGPSVRPHVFSCRHRKCRQHQTAGAGGAEGSYSCR